MLWTSCLLLLVLCAASALAGHYSEEQQRWFYPEFKERAEKTRNVWRTKIVADTLKGAAGIYKNKTKGLELGHDRTVLITVVAYNERSFYKLYFHNLLCYMQHHDIDIVVYFLHHNMPSADVEIKSLTDMGIKVLPYPEELFWTLMQWKSTEARVMPSKVDYLSDVPSFLSHGALVMLVPVLEVLLAGYNTIFFDLDIALLVDPIPFLTRGKSDFVASIEMRSCPDKYTPTFLNPAQTMVKKKHVARVNSMDDVNWHTIEANTGIMMVRSTEAGIGFYTHWLLRIIDMNIGNDQKALFRFPEEAHYSRDCLYGEHADSMPSMAHFFEGNKRAPPSASHPTPHTLHSLHHPPPPGSHGGVPSDHHAPPHGPHGPHGLPRGPPHGPPHSLRGGAHHSQRPRQNIAALRARWANYTTLVEDAATGNFAKPMKFCFLSELLFQNGQTAFTCAVKPSFRDSYILEMDKKGLKSPTETGNAKMLHTEEDDKSASNVRFPVTLHANFCDKKTHELTVRGLWLVNADSPEHSFNQSTCRAYDPLKTHAATFNWSEEVAQVKHKRQYMYETFVVPGGLIQSTIGMEVYIVNAQLQKQMIPDGETFVATVGENKWGAVRFLPQEVMDNVTTGQPLLSVKGLPPAPVQVPLPPPVPVPVTPPALAPAEAAPVAVAPVHETPVADAQPASAVTPATATPSDSTASPTPPPMQPVTVDGNKFFVPPAVAADVPFKPANAAEQVVQGMLVRAPGSQVVYYVDKHLFRRKIPNMQVFHRLFGTRHYDIVTLPERTVMRLRAGEPLV